MKQSRRIVTLAPTDIVISAHCSHVVAPFFRTVTVEVDTVPTTVKLSRRGAVWSVSEVANGNGPIQDNDVLQAIQTAALDAVAREQARSTARLQETADSLLSAAAIANCEAASAELVGLGLDRFRLFSGVIDWRQGFAEDVDCLRNGGLNANELLAALLEEVDAARVQGWRDYVDAVADAARLPRAA
jgi:hypothetical protein